MNLQISNQSDQSDQKNVTAFARDLQLKAEADALYNKGYEEREEYLLRYEKYEDMESNSKSYPAIKRARDRANASFNRAFKLLKKSAELGNASAMNCYALLLRDRGRKRDEEESFEWFKKSADLGCIESMHAVYCCYEEGKGTPVNLKMALEYLKKYRDAGNERHSIQSDIDKLEALIKEKESSLNSYISKIKKAIFDVQAEIRYKIDAEKVIDELVTKANGVYEGYNVGVMFCYIQGRPDKFAINYNPYRRGTLQKKDVNKLFSNE